MSFTVWVTGTSRTSLIVTIGPSPCHRGDFQYQSGYESRECAENKEEFYYKSLSRKLEKLKYSWISSLQRMRGSRKLLRMTLKK
ncbi:hypothetical protein TSUD_179630 [Trifolium subterraneum]|uniref:Uncharacterized protein n=1 Tax=Trifolium subterraneum TaxID=3900 RepID=A0A2Z6NH68_TRISU|nr:hypothetical protein TSUD_179630 [Trifolium subterraneum]